MGTNAAEGRLLWSPFSCPSVEDPLKDKQVGETCRQKGEVQWLCCLFLVFVLLWLILLFISRLCSNIILSEETSMTKLSYEILHI